MNQKTRKLMTMQKALHQGGNINRIYVSRKRRTRASIEDCVEASIRRLKGYIKKSKERLMTAASNSNDNIRTNRTTKPRTNYNKTKIDNTQQNCKCRLRGDKDKKINHIISKCSRQMQKKVGD